MRIIVVLLYVCAAIPALANEALRLDASREFLQELLEAPISDSRTISETVKKTVITGTAITEGTITLDLLPSDRSAKFLMQLEAITNSHMVGENQPTKRITVDVTTAARTSLAAWKPLELTAPAINAADAVCRANTNLWITDVDAEVRVRFPRVFSGRVRYEKAMEGGQKEAQRMLPSSRKKINDQAETDTVKLVNDKAKPLLEQLNRDYYSQFYKPLILDGKLPATLQYSTTGNLLSIQFLPKTAVTDEAAKARPSMPKSSAIAFRLNDAFLDQAVLADLSGRKLDEEDLEEFFIKNGIPSGLGKYRGKREQVTLTMCRDNPFRVSFGEKLKLSLCSSVPAVDISATYRMSVSREGEMHFQREGKARVVARGDAVENGDDLTERFSRIIPPSIKLGKYALPSRRNANADLRVVRANMENGWLTAEWEWK